MNSLLWTAQICTALIFLVMGSVKLLVPREKLATQIHWAAEGPGSRIKRLGLAEVAGVLGLVLPVAPGIAPPLHLCENFAPGVVVALLCLSIAVGHVQVLRSHSAETQAIRLR